MAGDSARVYVAPQWLASIDVTVPCRVGDVRGEGSRHAGCSARRIVRVLAAIMLLTRFRLTAFGNLSALTIRTLHPHEDHQTLLTQVKVIMAQIPIKVQI
jgi:hypothetical protein